MRLLILPLVCLCFSSAGQAAENFYVGARLGVTQYDGTADASRNTAAGPMLPSEISVDTSLYSPSNNRPVSESDKP